MSTILGDGTLVGPFLRGGAALALAALVSLSPCAGADRVITRDGRVLTPLKAREVDGGYLLIFESGEILLRDKSLVKAVEIEGDMSDYVPKDDNERKKLEQGYVRYQGKWLSKPAYQDQLRAEHRKSRARADEMAAHARFQDGWTKETKHFVFKTNTSPELLDHYAELLEAYYGLMDDEIGIDPTPTYRRLKMKVNVYKSYEDFHRNAAAEISPSVVGYFWAHDNTLNFFHDYQDPGYTQDVALHECTHLLTFLIDQQFQPQIWINEAVADYFGIATVERDKRGRPVITPGALQTDLVLTVQQAIEDGDDVKLSDLFLIDRDAFSGFEYAHAWSFVYFLNQGRDGRYAKGFAKFFKGLYTLEKGIDYEIVDAPPPTGTGKRVKPEVIRDYLLKRVGAPDVETLEKEWKEFVAAIPIEGPRARFLRGFRAIQQGRIFADSKDETQRRLASAKADLDAAIEGGITDPRAFWARSKLSSVEHRRDEALADLERAIELDPLEPAFRFEKGLLLADGVALIGFGRGNVDISPSREATVETCPEAAPCFGLAAELAPENELYKKRYERFLGH